VGVFLPFDLPAVMLRERERSRSRKTAATRPVRRIRTGSNESDMISLMFHQMKPNIGTPKRR